MPFPTSARFNYYLLAVPSFEPPFSRATKPSSKTSKTDMRVYMLIQVKGDSGKDGLFTVMFNSSFAGEEKLQDTFQKN